MTCPSGAKCDNSTCVCLLGEPGTCREGLAVCAGAAALLVLPPLGSPAHPTGPPRLPADGIVCGAIPGVSPGVCHKAESDPFNCGCAGEGGGRLLPPLVLGERPPTSSACAASPAGPVASPARWAGSATRACAHAMAREVSWAAVGAACSSSSLRLHLDQPASPRLTLLHSPPACLQTASCAAPFPA